MLVKMIFFLKVMFFSQENEKNILFQITRAIFLIRIFELIKKIFWNFFSNLTLVILQLAETELNLGKKRIYPAVPL